MITQLEMTIFLVMTISPMTGSDGDNFRIDLDNQNSKDEKQASSQGDLDDNDMAITKSRRVGERERRNLKGRG